MFLILVYVSSCGSQENSSPAVDVVDNKEKQQVEVLVDGKLFTAYLYTDKIDALKKTTLYPIVTAKGNDITRGFPLKKRAGERVDHPHHLGMWLNYGDVNGLDYWNNSDAIPEERQDRMGVIRHKEIMKVESGKGKGSIEASMNWLNPDGSNLLKEETKFVFYADKDLRVIDRISKISALDKACFI